MDTRIRIIAEDITKDGVNALNRLIELEKELKIETEAANQAQKNSNTETNKSIGIIKSLEDEIQRLIKLRKESTDTTQIAAYNRQIGLQEAELKKLTDTQQKSNVLTKEQNAQIQTLTGTTEKSNGMFKNLAATMLGLFAVDRIIDYSKQMFDLVINSDRMNIALKNVTQSNQEYHQSLEFLNKLSNDYGQNVNVLKESYVSFLASSKSTNLSVKERQGIYESIIKAGSALTLSNDAIEGSLRAVSQMFSKGNVSAEELRGQLGERLPGAFGIMAEALGVNEKKLNKMLEQGEVLAEEALPKFAKALEEAYGDKAKSNIDTVTGASNRFGRSLTENLTKINENTGFTKALASGINFLADNFKTLVNVIVGAGAALAAYTLKQVFSNSVAKIQLINLGQEVLAKQAASVATLELTAAETAAAAAATRFNAAMAAAPYGAALIALSALVTMILQHNDAQQRAYELTEAGIKATDEEIKGERAHAVELGITIDQTKKLAYGTEERLTNVRKLMAQYPQYFKDMTAEQVSNWHLTNAYRGVNAEIERKITLLAREKSVQGLTNRAAEIKAELEQLGVFTTNLNEYNKQNESLSNSFKNIRGKILEYNQVMLNLDKTTLRLTDSQKQMFNQEARNNKARLEAGLISEKEFKAEVMRIQDVYGIKVQNYKLEEKLIAGGVDNNKKANDKKLNGEKELNKKLKAEKEAFQQKISDIENRGEEERAFERQKAMNKIFSIYSGTHDKINKVEKSAAQTSKEIGENQTKTLTERVNKETEILKDKTNEKVKFFESIYKSHGQFLNKWYTDMNDMERQAFDYSLGMMRDMLANMNYELDQQLDGATTNLEKAIIKNQKAWIGVADSAIGSVEQLAQGNFVGAIVGGVTTVFKAIDTAADRTYELELARIEDLRIAAEKFGQELLDASSKIINTEDINEFKNLYGSVFTEVVATWKSEDVASIFGFQQAIDNEKQVAESINRNFEVAKTREEELYQQKIKSINDAYNLDVEKINAKYDLLATKNSQRFDAESLAIQKGVNEDLMGFVTNQDLKLGLLSQYNGKRAEIESRFALSYTPIVEGMTQAQIDGINESIKARDEEIAKLESWQTTQIQFVIDNGKLERDTFTETQKIIAKGKDDQYLLSLEYKEKDIQLSINKGIELDALEKTRKENELTALNEHKVALAKIEADYYVLIGNSFNLMKSLVLGGYDEILKKAQEALEAGKITALEFNNLVNDITFKMTNLKNTFGPGNWNLPDIVPNVIPEIEPIRIPGFKTGTEMVGGIKGVDKNLAWLSNDEAVLQGDLNKKRLDAGINRFQMVEYAINYKSILDGGFQPLQIKTSALDKLEEHKAMQYLINMNVGEIVDKLSAVEKSILGKPTQIFDLSDGKLREYVKTDKNVTIFKNKRLK